MRKKAKGKGKGKKGNKGKGKGKKGKGKKGKGKGKKGKGKGKKGKGKGKKNGKGKGQLWCATCQLTSHSWKDCWFNPNKQKVTRAKANGETILQDLNRITNHGTIQGKVMATGQIHVTVIMRQTSLLARHLVMEFLTCVVAFKLENAGLGTNVDSLTIPTGDAADQARQEVMGINST